MGDPIYLASQSVTANNPAAAISTANVPTTRRTRLTVVIDNSLGTLDVSLTAPAAAAHSPYRVPAGDVGEVELAWPQPAGALFASGISLFASAGQAVAVGLGWA